MSRRVLGPIVILITAGLVYSNSLYNEFHLDDSYRVVDNPGIERLHPVWRHFVDPRTMTTLPRISQFRPLLPLTLSLNHEVHGYELPGYHIVNLLCHATASILLFFLVLELLLRWSRSSISSKDAEWTALVVSLLFAVHPVMGIVVNYICSRDLAMMQMFFLATLLGYLYIRRAGETWLRWAAVLLLFTLSLLSKTNGVVMPLVALLCELLLVRGCLFSIKTWRGPLLFAGIVALFFGYTHLILGFSDTAQVVADGGWSLGYLAGQLELHVFHYLRNFFWPFALCPVPAAKEVQSFADPYVLAGSALIAASIIIAWCVRRKSPLLSFCILMYWVMLAPTSSIFIFHQPAMDYRPLPAAPFFLLGCALVIRQFIFRIGAALIAVGLILYLAAASYQLNQTWRTGETLWSQCIRYGGSSLAHLNLAMSISDRSDPRVEYHLRRALQQSPQYVVAHINLGLLLIDQGKGKEGFSHMLRALQIRPNWAQPNYWLSRAYHQIGQLEQAYKFALEAARLDPRNIRYQYWAVQNLQWQEKYEESLRYIASIEKVQSDYRRLSFLKGFALQKLGRRREAIELYHDYLATNPEYYQAHFNLGYALMKEGRCTEAISSFKRVLVEKPEYAEAELWLEHCREKSQP